MKSQFGRNNMNGIAHHLLKNNMVRSMSVTQNKNYNNGLKNFKEIETQKNMGEMNQ